MKKDDLEVLLEDINGKFNPVLEGHAVLRSEIRELGRKNDERFDLIDLKIGALSKRGDTGAHHGACRVMEREE